MYKAYFHSLLQGFSDLIPLRLIQVFDEREMEVRHSYVVCLRTMS